MDIKRIVLLVAFVFVTSQLWIAWKTENGPAIAAPAVVAQAQSQGSDVPALVNQAQADRDVPSLSANVPATSSKETSGKQVRVKTDVLDVVLDLKGGSMVRADLLKYENEIDTPDVPVTIMSPNSASLYIAQSGLTGAQGPDTTDGAVTYTTEKTTYDLAEGQNSLAVDLTWKDSAGLNVTKRYTFKRGEYDVNVKYLVENKTDTAWTGNFYAQIKRKEVKPEKKSFFVVRPYSGASMSLGQEKLYKKLPFDKLSKRNVDDTAKGGWIAMQQPYFVSAWVPGSNDTNRYYSRYSSSDNVYTLGVFGPQLTAQPGSSVTTDATLFVGPELLDELSAIAPGLDMTVDYGWFWMISMGLFFILKQIYSVVGNWGWSIILITVLIKAAFYPLSAKSYRSMAKMRKLQPKLQDLQKRYADDKQKLGQATLELYRKEKVNPFSGCWPILIQIPIFIALYWVLIESVELRHAPFILWLQNLSAPDPYYILPILMGLSMYVQQRLSPQAPDPTQAKIMLYVMPTILTLLFLYFPSGLVLYWVANNVLSVAQQWYIMRQVEAMPVPKGRAARQK